jgi:hypothetical protein
LVTTVRIPIRYHIGMTKQVAVRLPDDLVEFMDELVASGEESSRASFVARAVRRERRRMGTLREIEILTSLGGEPYPDLAGVAGYASKLPLDVE